MDLFKLLGIIEIDNKEANDALDKTSQKGQDTESKLSKFFSGVGKGAAVVGKAVGAGMLAAGTAVAGLSTAAIKSYADYEQLVGGVETLFGDSAKNVLNYANQAYQSAGLSANQYMETVTSFSASLLQSLDGDTAAAADKANQAIVDMSDNANKMGSSMESIQNAYQGFAKQNYTMLDNLKLGYGGTQEEMKRLLADAEAISGIEYDISSYADVVDAIHVIQTEMGIAGTTAKEASTTISGSISSMKASWSDLMTAMASDDLDLEVYINGFVASVSTVMDNLLPRIEQTLSGVVYLIQELAPKIIAVLPGLLATLLPAVISTAMSLLDAVLATLPSLISAIVDFLPDVIEGITQLIIGIVDALPILLDRILEGVMLSLPALISGLIALTLAICEELPNIIEVLITYLPSMLELIVSALSENLPILIQACIDLVLGIVEYMPTIMQSIIDILPSVITDIVVALIECIPLLVMGFVQLIAGVTESRQEIWGSLIESIPAIFAEVWEGIKTALAPLGEWINTNIVQPVAEFFTGLWQSLKNVWDSICNVIEFAVLLISEILTTAFEIITLPFRFIWENCKEYVFSAWEWIVSKVTAAIDAVRNVITRVMTAIRNFLSPILEAIKGTFSNVWDNITNVVQNAVNAVKTKVSDAIDKVKSTISNGLDTAKSTVSRVLDAIKDKFTSVFDKAKEIVTNAIDKIKGAFDFDWSLPHLKLPHFSISGKFSLDPPSVPSFGIDWYKKAYDNAMLLSNPTIFGYSSESGKFLGGGDGNGSEVVAGSQTLMGMIQAAVSEQNNGLAAILMNILDAIIALDENMGGNLREALAGTSFEVNKREFARLVKAVNYA